MAKNQNIKIGDATITPAALEVLERWADNDIADCYCYEIAIAQDGLNTLLVSPCFDDNKEAFEIFRQTIGLLLDLKRDLRAFSIPKEGKGGES